MLRPNDAREVIRRSRATGARMNTLFVVVLFANPDSRIARAKPATIAGYANCDEKTVRRARDWLVEHGEIEVLEFRGKGPGRSTRYRLPDPPVELAPISDGSQLRFPERRSSQDGGHRERMPGHPGQMPTEVKAFASLRPSPPCPSSLRSDGHPPSPGGIGLEQLHEVLRGRVGQATWDIWLADLQVIDIDVAGAMILAVGGDPGDPRNGWVAERFGGVLAAAAEMLGVQVTLAPRPVARPMRRRRRARKAA